MMEKMMPYGYPPSINKFKPEQIMQIGNWDRVEDAKKGIAAMTTIHIIPEGSTTIAYVNPLDTGNEAETWRYVPHAYGPVIPARCMR